MSFKKYMAIVIFCCFIFSPGFTSAATIQPAVAPAIVAPAVVAPAVVAPLPVIATDISLEPKITKILQGNTVATLFTKLNKVDKEISVLNEDLKVKGFQPLTGNTNFWGVRNTYSQKTSQNVEEKTILSLYVQDYSSVSGSRDIAAVGQLEIVGSCGRRETYSFYLIAPGGRFDLVEEYKIDQTTLSVLRANSWWSCVCNYIKSRCAAPCVNALTTCPTSSWTAYLTCLASKCGWCWVKAGVCCACNCKWWCKWAAGCCRQ